MANVPIMRAVLGFLHEPVFDPSFDIAQAGHALGPIAPARNSDCSRERSPRAGR